MKKVLGIALSGAFALSSLAVSSTTAQAQTKSTYGAAGCGLGAMLIGDTPGIVQVFAATLNGVSGNQTFGITSGTLNCGTTTPGMVGAATFIETNREVVAKDISRGSGETLATLTTLGGCNDQRAVGASLQREFSSIFPTNAVSDVEVSHNVISVLRSDKALACTKLN